MIDEKALDNYECNGQMSIFDLYPEEPESKLIAVSKIFARAMKQMNLQEWKTFVYALTKIRWTEKNGATIYLDKKKLAGLVGINSDQDHLSENLFRSIKDLPKHSFIEISDSDRGYYESGVFVTRLAMFKGRVRIKFEQDYLPLFQELNNAREGYITMWAGDLFQMSSERSILFYEDLRLHGDTRKENSIIYTTKQLKEMFGIPKDGKGSYMQANGKFNRLNFENRVLTPICEDLKKSQMIDLILNPDGSYWEKVKSGGRVIGYRFAWTISTHPRTISAKEVRKLNQDPATLKIAGDIKKGQKKKAAASGSGKKSGFKNFHEREMSAEDFENLEAALLRAQQRDMQKEEPRADQREEAPL